MFEVFIKWILPGLAGLVAFLYFYFKNKYSYWSSRGIPGPKPIWFIGTYQRVFSCAHYLECKWVQIFGKVFGCYFGTTPIITIADPELVKKVLIKDFHHFTNRVGTKSFHELWNKNLFFANGDDWKRIRTIASPTFSSGKLRGMNPIMQKCIDSLDQYFETLVESDSKGVIDVKQTFAGFTVDVIASTAFATETNANADRNNPFVVNGKALLDIKPLRGLASVMFPAPLLKLLGIESFLDPEPFNFFINLSRHILSQRKAAGSAGARNDLVQLLIDANVDEKEMTNANYANMTVTDAAIDETSKETHSNTNSIRRKLTDGEIIANLIFFFIAGYETTASAISHCIFELANNPDMQERLHRELHKVLDPISDKNSSEYFDAVLNNIPYLEAVIKETMRLYAPLSVLNRVCTKDGYQLRDDIVLNKGYVVVIPTVAIHLHADYHPDPKKFNPDRFMPENKDNLVPYSYLPFSLGPRNCIAMRFAYQEIKLCLAKIVQKYRFERTEQTPEELTFKPSPSGLLIANPFSVKVCKR